MYITLENAAATESCGNESRWAVVLQLEGERLVETQRIALDERSASRPSSFALDADGGSVWCAVWGSDRLHELVRAEVGDQVIFKEASKKHVMPEKMYWITGFETAGNRRLAVSCFDNSVRLFDWGRLGPLEVTRLQRTTDFWLPSVMASLPDWDALIVTNGKKSALGEWQTALELFSANGSGSFSTPTRLLSTECSLYIWSILFYRNPSDGRLKIVIYDGHSKCLKTFDFV